MATGAPPPPPMTIIPAPQDAAATLTEIAVAAKSHWGYPPGWLDRWRQELTITPRYLAAHPVFIARDDARPVGFYALCCEGEEARLDHLWVRPSYMRQGVGRALFVHAEAAARQRGARRLHIVGDPHAEGFYLRMGATPCGRKPAPMDEQERFLPLFEKALPPSENAG